MTATISPNSLLSFFQFLSLISWLRNKKYQEHPTIYSVPSEYQKYAGYCVVKSATSWSCQPKRNFCLSKKLTSDLGSPRTWVFFTPFLSSYAEKVKQLLSVGKWVSIPIERLKYLNSGVQKKFRYLIHLVFIKFALILTSIWNRLQNFSKIIFRIGKWRI